MVARAQHTDHHRIVRDPKILAGKPVVAGTRITVELILEKLASGESVEQVLDACPRLTRQGVLAALDFAARTMKADVVYPIEMESPIGRLTYLRPVVQLSHTPPGWTRPPVPLGTHRAEWPIREF